VPALTPFKLVILLGGCLLLDGCSGLPSSSFERAALEHGFRSSEIQGKLFRHRIYFNALAKRPVERLHIYIDGDGTPWRRRGQPALDPTPRNPLVLRLMALDSAPAIYLGRPCYAGLSETSPCHPWFWTHGRYSEPVVASMAEAVKSVSASLEAGEIVLIGYSGGGTLAMLLAPRLQRAAKVATLAANLDLRSWTKLHGFSPLKSSLDPATQPPLPPGIQQWHWVGEEDRQVPPQLVRRALATQPSPHFAILPQVNHRSGWERHWPELLQRLSLPQKLSVNITQKKPRP